MTIPAVVLAAALSLQGAPAGEGKGDGVSRATVTRLGDVAPSRSDRGDGELHSHGVSAAPIVLWSREGAPAVLYVERSVTGVFMVGGVAKTKIGVLSGGARKLGGALSPFPIRVRSAEIAGGEEADFLAQAWPVDLDGDGHDELVTITWFGTVEVFDARRRRARWENRGGRVQVQAVHTASIGGKGMMLISLSRQHTERGEGEERPDPYVLLRVDAAGVSPIQLRDLGFDVEELLGAGFVSRPGSNGPDEIVVALEKRRRDEGAVYFSRHGLDGRILGPPRRAAGSGFYGHTFEHLPGSDTSIDWYVQDRQLYLVAPRREQGWFHHLDLDRTCKDGAQAEYLGVMDRDQAPKVAWACRGDLFAADLEGRPLAMDGGRWRVAPAPAPFLRSAPPMEGQTLSGVLFDGDTTLLVYARGRTIRQLPQEELYAAALRFLPLEQIEQERRIHALELEENPRFWDPTRKSVDEERERRKITAPIRNVEDWKRLLPDHYERTRREEEAELRRSLAFNVTYPLRQARDLSEGNYREVDAYRRWLSRLDLTAQTSFVVLRNGEKVGEFSVRGCEARVQDDEPIAPSISFRARPGGGVAVVMALDEGQESGDEPPPPADPVQPGFYLIEWKAGDGAR